MITIYARRQRNVPSKLSRALLLNTKYPSHTFQTKNIFMSRFPCLYDIIEPSFLLAVYSIYSMSNMAYLLLLGWGGIWQFMLQIFQINRGDDVHLRDKCNPKQTMIHNNGCIHTSNKQPFKVSVLRVQSRLILNTFHYYYSSVTILWSKGYSTVFRSKNGLLFHPQCHNRMRSVTKILDL